VGERKIQEKKSKIYRIMDFPCYLILGVHENHDTPIPIFTKTDGKTACHVEVSKESALRTAKELGELRVKYRALYSEVHGSALIEMKSLDELLEIINVMDPIPDGYVTEFHYDLQTDKTDWIYMDFTKIRRVDPGLVQ